jgi:hypothetical protein
MSTATGIAVFPDGSFQSNYILGSGGFNLVNLFMCLTAAKQGQLQPSTKTTAQDINIMKLQMT